MPEGILKDYGGKEPRRGPNTILIRSGQGAQQWGHGAREPHGDRGSPFVRLSGDLGCTPKWEPPTPPSTDPKTLAFANPEPRGLAGSPSS